MSAAAEIDGAAPPCLACGASGATFWARSRDLEYHTSEDEFRFYRCAHCDVLFIDPVPRERLAEIYPRNYYSFTADGHSLGMRVKRRLDVRRFRKLLAALPGEDLAVLDVGGGSGAQLDVIRAADSRVAFTQVVDLDAEATAAAERKGHAAFLGPIERFEGERAFDLILMLNLIEHVADPAAVLRAAAARLRPGGKILIQTPNTDSLDARWFRHADWGGYHCPRHWVLFDRESFSALARGAGLVPRRVEFTQGAAFWGTSCLFWLYRRGWVRIDAAHPAMTHPLFVPLSALSAAFDLLRARLGARPSQMVFELERGAD